MDVEAWLRSLGLEQYEAIFRENAIDETVLPHLTDGDLEKLGVLLGHRRKLLHAIANLKVVEKAAPTVAGIVQPSAPLPLTQDTQASVPTYDFRLTRLPYFFWTLLVVVVLVVFVVSLTKIGTNAADIRTATWLIATIASIVLAVGRLHDAGSSGWWSLLMFVPFVSFFVWLYLLFAPSADPTEAASNVTAPAQAGTRVMHYRLGSGTIIATTGPWAEVKFDGKVSVRRIPMRQLQIR